MGLACGCSTAVGLRAGAHLRRAPLKVTLNSLDRRKDLKDRTLLLSNLYILLRNLLSKL